ncbi:MAG TPA: RNB domain-containing ribonuclease [Terriglobales bacterium]|nr:RNB domain-containing ribonuclease [Terriglobales bacterium]
MVHESAILKKIERQPRHIANFKQLVRELGIRGDERRRFAELLDKMVARGELMQVDGDRYALPKTPQKSNLAVGRLIMHRDGYGFVVPEDTALKERLNGDIFISPQAIGSAMHGDRVLVELGRVRPDGRAEGRIVKIVFRAQPTVVGTFHYGSRYNYVTPMDEKITQDVVIPRGAEIPEKHAEEEGSEHKDRRTKHGESRHRVLGKEAKRRTAVSEDLEGVVVDVEITDWPTPTQNPRGKVIEILGNEDDFGVDVEIIIRKHHLPHRFPGNVLDEAQSIENVIPGRELRARRDYRDLPIVTIDGETARDFDDAVTVNLLANGSYELQVHIADVAQYVTPESALDQEARLRGTSVYFPDRAVPMLPIELSTDICSLRPQVERLVMSCVMEIDHQGEVLGYEIHPGVIRSAERMTYTDVNLIIEGDKGLRQRYAHLGELFDRMRDLALILNKKRERRGSIDFDLPEPVIEFDEHGLMKSVTRSERNIAHRLIEEFMLAANESVAEFLEHRGVASIYRIHEKPDPKRVFDFETIAATFGYSLGVGALPIQRFPLRSERRASHGTGRRPRELEIPQEVHITPRMYQKLTKKIAGKPEERILSYLMLRSLKQARYSEENVGHFALAAPTYTHFTSPIRRYPDLIVHRILKEVLRGSEEAAPQVGERGHATHAGSHGVAPRREQEHKPSPWSKRGDKNATQEPAHKKALTGPIALSELHEIAEDSSVAERRADEAERELMEWKKVKFMSERVGEDFDGLIVSVTKFGFFVELSDLFIEGLVPLSTLTDDRYTYHENTKEIIGQRTGKMYRLGQRVRVLVDRIDPVQKKIQFSVIEEEPSRAHRRRKRA